MEDISQGRANYIKPKQDRPAVEEYTRPLYTSKKKTLNIPNEELDGAQEYSKTFDEPWSEL